jgi:hypothetical protein
MIALGQRPADAAAGMGRVLHRLGRIDEGIEKLADYPGMSSEMRRVLILLRLARIQSLEKTAMTAAEEQYTLIFEEMAGGIDPVVRADLLCHLAAVAIAREELTWAVRAIRELQRRFERDLRAIVLDAWVEDARGAPIEEERGRAE